MNNTKFTSVLNLSVYQNWVDERLLEGASLEAVFFRFVDFLRHSLNNYPNRFHTWTEKDNRVLEAVKHAVEDFIYLEYESWDVVRLVQDLELTFRLYVPICWGALSDVYFGRWADLRDHWNFEDEEV